MPTTQQGPIRVNGLINKLKLLPGDMRIEIVNEEGRFYIQDLIVANDCSIELTLVKIPQD